MGWPQGGAVLHHAEASMIVCLFAGFISALCGIAVALGMAQ